jgi:glyoxylase-like metal-dependent hydrolase (beta-lactamase superfamily II)
MYFRQLIDRADGVLTYVLADFETHEALVIDPTSHQRVLVRAVLAEHRLTLRWVLRTHCHRDDNATGCATLCAETGATQIGGDAGFGGNVGHAGGDMVVVWGNEIVRVLATPGHTPESASFLWRDRLFCGDALEPGGCGAATGPDADAGQLYDSVVGKLFSLPGETLVFPGHVVRGRTVSTIAEERSANPFFVGRTRDAFVVACNRNSLTPSRSPGRAARRIIDAANATPTRSS